MAETFNGWNIVTLPLTQMRSVDFTAHEIVAVNTSPWSGQTQTYDWGQAFLSATVTLATLTRAQAAAWVAALMACRGPLNVFVLGDPSQTAPFGTAGGTPVVNGVGQSGFSLVTKGWPASASAVLRPGDYLSILSSPVNVGDTSVPRLYRVTAQVASDSGGNATIPIWPPLRESPANGAAITLNNPHGLFRRAKTEQKWNVNYDRTASLSFDIVEAL